MPKVENPEEFMKKMEEESIQYHKSLLVPIKLEKSKDLYLEYRYWIDHAKDANLDLNTKAKLVFCDYTVKGAKDRNGNPIRDHKGTRISIYVENGPDFESYPDRTFDLKRPLFEGTYEECVNALIWGLNWEYPPYYDDHYLDAGNFYYYNSKYNSDKLKSNPFKSN